MLYTEGRGAFWNSVRKVCNKWLDKTTVLMRKKRHIASKSWCCLICQAPMSMLHPALDGDLLDFPTIHSTDNEGNASFWVVWVIIFLQKRGCSHKNLLLHCCRQGYAGSGAEWELPEPPCSWGVFVAQHRPEATLDMQHGSCHGWHWLLDVQKAPARDQCFPPLGPHAAYLSQIFMYNRLP